MPDDAEPVIRRTGIIKPHSLEELEEMEKAGYKITDVPKNLERMETPVISDTDTTWKIALYINGESITYKLESFRRSRMQNIRTLWELGEPFCEFNIEKTLIFDTVDVLAEYNRKG